MLSVTLAIAEPNGKVTTNGFRRIEVSSLEDLIMTLNANAVSAGLYMNGYRNKYYLKGMGNIVILDFDKESLEDEKPYYLQAEDILREQNISYVSVPSQGSLDNHHKRHIGIILSNSPIYHKEQYIKLIEKMIEDLKINSNWIDKNVLGDTTRHIAPASINKKFYNYNALSNYFDGVPYRVQDKFIDNRSYSVENSVDINSLIEFKNGTKVSIEDSKKIVPVGSHLSCRCPNHKDNNPSATFYHNSDGSVRLFCQVCKNVAIKSNVFGNSPKISHQNYMYLINVCDPKKELESYFGKPSMMIEKNSVWCFTVKSIEDIYKIFLAKKRLVEDGYKLFELDGIKDKIDCKKCDTNILSQYVVNEKPLNHYIKYQHTFQMTPAKSLHIQAKEYVSKGIINPEIVIWLIYQNFFSIQDFEEICNSGLSRFEDIMKTIEAEKDIKFQKDKTYPIRTKSTQCKSFFKNREEMRIKSVKPKMDSLEKKIYRLMNNPNFQRKNGCYQTKIANHLKIHRNVVSKYIKKINEKI